MPFLTDLDRRAEVKGSRDPLGLMAIWSHFGRKVVGNLTTVTSTVRGFTTLLLGLHLAEKVRDTARGERPSTLEVFLKFEQLAGYARVHCNGDNAVRGWRRIRARLDGSKAIRISTRSDHQILSNQKVYGLWGLFMTAARNSDLLLPGQPRLTDEAQQFVERRHRAVAGKAVVDLLRRDDFVFEPKGRHAELARSLADAHGSPMTPDEQPFYREHLVWGGPADPTAGRQKLLAELVEQHRTEDFTYREFRAVRNSAARRRDGTALVEELDRIDALEQLVNPARVAFGFVLTQNGRMLGDVAKQISDTWTDVPRLSPLLPEIRATIALASWNDSASRWMRIGECLTSRDHLALIEMLIEANTDVMQKRNGSAPWVTIEAGRLRVREADEAHALIPWNEVENLWRSTYFINSLWSVAREVSPS